MSRRQFFSILLMFLTMFALFQGLSEGKKRWNDYESNTRVEDTGLTAGDQWSPERRSDAGPEAADVDRPADHAGYVVFVGEEASPAAETARQWALYKKREIRFLSSFDQVDRLDRPEILLAEGEALAADLQGAGTLMTIGIDLAVLNLPDPEVLVRDRTLQDMLGIFSVRSPSVRVEGIRLFPGFLLGGERIYQAADEKEEKRQDLDLEIPWYVVRVGTTTYLQGILAEEDAMVTEEVRMDNEDYPALIWRNSYLNAEVFVVSGDFLSDPWVGMGVLDGIMAQRAVYTLYPVVNAQLNVFRNYPEGADENQEAFRQIYGSDQTDVQRNILLPMFTSLVSRYHLPLTYTMAPQLDYRDDHDPEPGLLDYYLMAFNELGCELGLSLERRDDLSLRAKVLRDGDYIHGEDSSYPFSSLGVSSRELDGVEAVLGESLLERICTAVCDGVQDRPVVSYLTRDVTLQQITSSGDVHTFGGDLRLLALETSLGYANMGFDMSRVLWPGSKEDEWQYKSQDVFANMTTYTAPFSAFDRLTASQSDARVRRFLNLDYTTDRKEDVVRLYVENFQKEAYFVLRTHREEIDRMWGGTWTRIEEDAYLISARQADVEIRLRSTLKSVEE